jgi:hypothetical protein
VGGWVIQLSGGDGRVRHAVQAAGGRRPDQVSPKSTVAAQGWGSLDGGCHSHARGACGRTGEKRRGRHKAPPCPHAGLRHDGGGYVAVDKPWADGEASVEKHATRVRERNRAGDVSRIRLVRKEHDTSSSCLKALTDRPHATYGSPCACWVNALRCVAAP